MNDYLAPRPRRHPERDFEDQILAYVATFPGVKDVARQVRIPKAGIADVVFYAEVEDEDAADGIARLIGVIEVKADRANIKALAQINRYIAGLQAYFGEDCHPITWTGGIAARSFSPELERLAEESPTFGLFRMGRTA